MKLIPSKVCADRADAVGPSRVRIPESRNSRVVSVGNNSCYSTGVKRFGSCPNVDLELPGGSQTHPNISFCQPPPVLDIYFCTRQPLLKGIKGSPAGPLSSPHRSSCVASSVYIFLCPFCSCIHLLSCCRGDLCHYHTGTVLEGEPMLVRCPTLLVLAILTSPYTSLGTLHDQTYTPSTNAFYD